MVLLILGMPQLETLAIEKGGTEGWRGEAVEQILRTMGTASVISRGCYRERSKTLRSGPFRGLPCVQGRNVITRIFATMICHDSCTETLLKFT